VKIAITTAGEDLSAPIDARFGRAPRFLIYQTGTGAFHLKENAQNLNAAQGAGIQAAMNLCQEKVDAVITGNCGPKAFAALEAARIAVYACEGLPAGEAIEKLKRGELERVGQATVEGHWE